MTDKQEKTILSTRDVRLWYGQKEALHGIDLDFPNKGITALIGPSGSGKTTYLRALNRMHDLEDGVTVTGSFNLMGLIYMHQRLTQLIYASESGWFFNNLTHFHSQSMKTLFLGCV